MLQLTFLVFLITLLNLVEGNVRRLSTLACEDSNPNWKKNPIFKLSSR